MEALIGLRALLLHGLNMWISRDYLDEYSEYVDASKVRTVTIKGYLVASLEDNIIWCLLNRDRFPPLISPAVMMYATKEVDIDYMVDKASELGCRDLIVSFISYVHYAVVEEVGRFPEIMDIHYKVLKRYLNTHKDIEKYVVDEFEEFFVSPYHVIMESWKQMRAEPEYHELNI